MMSSPSMRARAEALGPVAVAVAEGLLAPTKSLPPWLFYDAEGSRLFEEITRLPEYYLTRAEAQIFADHADEIVAAALSGAQDPLKVIELGAGTATKTQTILDAVVRTQGSVDYLPIDVSAEALAIAHRRLAREAPQVRVRPLPMQHVEALAEVRRLGPRRMVLFIGSSIGNYDDDDAIALLRAVRASVAEGAALLVGTDTKKAPERVLPAYDDAQGVTARFNLGLLRRINDELGGHFDLSLFRHVARWNEPASRVELYLESTVDQRVPIDALAVDVALAAGERIHTESSHKYDDAHAERLFRAAGFAPTQTWRDRERLFAVRLARAV